MPAFVVLISLVAMVAWVYLWRRIAGGPPVEWTRATRAGLALAILGAMAVPMLVGVLLAQR